MRKTVIFIFILAAGLGAQTGYSPPNLPDLLNQVDLTNMTTALTNMSGNFHVTQDSVRKHDADLYAPSGKFGLLSNQLQDTIGRVVNSENRLTAIQGSANAVIPATSYSATSGTIPLKEAGTCNPQVDVAGFAIGQSFDYSVTAPVSGSYLLVGCIASAATVPASFHFEYPVGTNLGSIGSSTIASPLASWSVFRQVPESAVVTLPAGPVTVRVVMETANFNWGGFLLAKQ